MLGRRVKLVRQWGLRQGVCVGESLERLVGFGKKVTLKGGVGWGEVWWRGSFLLVVERRSMHFVSVLWIVGLVQVLISSQICAKDWRPNVVHDDGRNAIWVKLSGVKALNFDSGITTRSTKGERRAAMECIGGSAQHHRAAHPRLAQYVLSESSISLFSNTLLTRHNDSVRSCASLFV